MADDDFDIDSLADYLHVVPAQVAKLAERGKLPGRRVGGAWRFARAEIHHWLEARIGALDDEELEHLEGALERAHGVEESDALSLTSMLPLESIAVPLEARTRTSVITSMVDLAAQSGWLWDRDRMYEAVRQREDLFPTALDNGVALLHPRRPLSTILDRPFLAMGRTNKGIPFGGQRGSLTDLFFLICSVDDSGHLRTLARLSRLLTDSQFMEDLREAPDPLAVHRLFEEREQQLLL